MALSTSLDRLSHLIGLIYDSAIDPSRWHTALDAIRVELRSANGAMNLHTVRDGQVLLNLTSNIPPEYEARIYDYGNDVIAQWGGRRY